MNAAERTTPIEILLVEDSESDVVLTQALFKEAQVMNHLSVARDGEEALRRVRLEGEHRDGPRPDLILLDLNLPRKDGREVLRELKQSPDPELRRISVVVLTTSARERDVHFAYEQHANAYITKPVDLDQFTSVVNAIEAFWLSVVRLPRSDG
jgi:two-component system, chemotaxis family, response regulator Rcp1